MVLHETIIDIGCHYNTYYKDIVLCQPIQSKFVPYQLSFLHSILCHFIPILPVMMLVTLIIVDNVFHCKSKTFQNGVVEQFCLFVLVTNYELKIKKTNVFMRPKSTIKCLNVLECCWMLGINNLKMPIMTSMKWCLDYLYLMSSLRVSRREGIKNFGIYWYILKILI